MGSLYIEVINDDIKIQKVINMASNCNLIYNHNEANLELH